MKKSTISIKWKIFAFLLCFCVLLLVILWLFQTVFLQRFYVEIKQRQVQREADELAGFLLSGDEAAFVEAAQKPGDTLVMLWNEAEGLVIVGGPIPEQMRQNLDSTQTEYLYQNAAENGGAFSMRYNTVDFPLLLPQGGLPQPGGKTPPDGVQPPGGQALPEGEEAPWQEDLAANPQWREGEKRNESMLHAEILTLPNGAEEMLVVVADLTPVDATVATLRVQLVIISVVMLALAVGIALLIAKRVAGPIEKLNNAAGELGRGHYDADFGADGYREVAELSATLNAAASELGKTEELRRDLVANVSHDLRTPLTLITGYAEMMRDIPGENSPENMQVIIDEAQRLSSLVSDLLDLSRLQSGTGEMAPGEYDLTRDIGEIIGRFSKLSATEDVRVVFRQNAEAVVLADSARIGQVVYNLLINAMHHGRRAGQVGPATITVAQSIDGGRVCVSVTDEGDGIPEKDLPYIWDRYYKIEEHHRRTATGSGLGLSIVKNILDGHPGVQYGVTSAEGVGSRFWFSLPLAGGGEEL